jgi:hypothetical protein
MLQHTRPGLSLQLLKLALFVLTALLVLILWGSLTGVQAQRRSTRQAATKTEAAPDVIEHPLYREYKGIAIGASADDVRGKLGEPKEKSDAQDYYAFSEQEMAQFYYDSAKKVKAITIDYIGETSGAPDYKTVVGAEVETRADGSMYKLVRYPSAGYWVSYNRTAPPAPIISVTMQKIGP